MLVWLSFFPVHTEKCTWPHTVSVDVTGRVLAAIETVAGVFELPVRYLSLYAFSIMWKLFHHLICTPVGYSTPAQPLAAI